MADADMTPSQDTETIPLDDAGDVQVPIVDVLTGRAFLTGKSGSGKSNTASVIAEELLDRGFPLLIVDTDGEYWGLKEEYELLHVGADDECDLQVGPEHAEKLAALSLERGVPIILDVSGYLDEDDARALVREVALALFAKEKKQRQPFLLLVEEIHEYIPQSGSIDETGQALVRIAKRGRKHGLGLAGISQRPADVKKDFITQCDWLVWHRLTWDNDTKVVRSVVNRETADAVPELADGEAFLTADFLDEHVQRVQVRRKRTFDAGATPDLEDFERPDLKSVSGDLVDELEEITEREQRRQDRLAQLEAILEDREQTIEELRDELERARDVSEMAERMAEALTSTTTDDSADHEVIQAKIDEIREEKNARITELEQENERLRETLRELREEKATLEERVEDLEEYEQAVTHLDELREGVERMAEALDLDLGDDAKLRQKLEQKDERIQALQAEVDRLEDHADGVTIPTEYQDFVTDEAVQQAMADAKEHASCSPRYIDGVVATIVQAGGPVDYERIANFLDVSTTTDVSKAASALERRGVVEKTQQSPVKVDFDMEGIATIKETMRRREEAERIMEDL